MDIYFLGNTTVRIRGKQTTLVLDPAKEIEAHAVLLTEKSLPYVHPDKVIGSRVTIDGPGEYEVGGASIVGVSAGKITTYYIKMDGVVLLYLGGLKRPLNDSEFDKYPNIDIVFVPVGGGIGINGKDGAAVVAKLEPKIVVPINFTPDSIEIFLKEIGKEGIAPQPKLSVTKEKLPQELEIVWLS